MQFACCFRADRAIPGRFGIRILSVLGRVVWLIGLCCCGSHVPAGEPPNIVLILADDLGWNDVSYHGNAIPTPNIDRFVGEGIELDRFYVAPYCVPTRAGLLTGRYPHRFGIPWQANLGRKHFVPTEAVTFAEVLAEAGYARRACIGKWHLGDEDGQRPLDQGFNRFYGLLGGMVDYFDHRTIPFGRNAANRPRLLDWHRGEDDCDDEGYSTDLIGTESVRFIAESAAQQPFLMYAAFNAPHLPLQAKSKCRPGPEDSRALFTGDAATNRAIYAEMVSSLDENVGRILDAIDQNGLREETLVLFLSDNGGVSKFGIGDNSPLRGGKNTVWEGGIRVPAAIRWPAAWEGGRRLAEPIAFVDVLPTLAHIAAATDLPDTIDGQDVSEILGQPRSDLDRQLYVGPLAIVGKRWKLVGGELFQVADDPGETSDVAALYPDVVESLKAELAAFSQ